MSDTDRLRRLFDVERVEAYSFRAPNPEEMSWGRVFGGQVVGQALRAAMLTVPEAYAAHSLHAYFIRGGQPGVPIRVEVDPLRDGRSFATRHTVAMQEDEVIFSMSCSFHKQEEGPEYQLPASADVPDPEDVAFDGDWMPGGRRRRRGPFGRGVESVEVGPTEPDERGVYASTRRAWLRALDGLGDDPVVHQCAIAFMSDMGAAMGARIPSLMTRSMGGASLDHSVWFHRAARADEWLLFDLQAVSNHNARGLTRGTLHTRDGVLVASIAQEALLRPTQRIPG